MGVSGREQPTNLNIEIKARVDDLDRIREYLLAHGAESRGTDHQKDTYLRARDGRLKIREGNVESCIVHYDRSDCTGPKSCRYRIEHFTPGDPVVEGLRKLLTAAIGVLCVVDKVREIYFIENVKFHLDSVGTLGTFFEIEAIDTDGKGEESLRKQCKHYLDEIGIEESQLVGASYSDMILNGVKLRL